MSPELCSLPWHPGGPRRVDSNRRHPLRPALGLPEVLGGQGFILGPEPVVIGRVGE